MNKGWWTVFSTEVFALISQYLSSENHEVHTFKVSGFMSNQITSKIRKGFTSGFMSV